MHNTFLLKIFNKTKVIFVQLRNHELFQSPYSTYHIRLLRRALHPNVAIGNCVLTAKEDDHFSPQVNIPFPSEDCFRVSSSSSSLTSGRGASPSVLMTFPTARSLARHLQPAAFGQRRGCQQFCVTPTSHQASHE